MRRFVLSILASLIMCISLSLLMIWMIPQGVIRGNVKESAEYLIEKDLFPYIKEGVFNTRQDNYADAILLNIIYYADSSHALASLLEGKYYRPEFSDVDDNLIKAVSDNPEANAEYSRYWHGSMLFIRPLLLFANLKQIRILLAVLAILPLGVSMFLLVRRGLTGYAISLGVGLLAIKVWMIAYSLEYVMTFIVMSSTLLGVLWIDKGDESKKQRRLITLFTVSGVFTCFLDFLTTETLPLTIPMLTLIVLADKSGNLRPWKSTLKQIFLHSITFILSYGVTFIVKWLLSAIFLGKEAFKTAFGSVVERSVGSVNVGQTSLSPKASVFQKIMGAIWRNIGCLFPFRDTMDYKTVMFLVLGVCITLFACIYLFHSNKYYVDLGILVGVLSLIPIMRFLVLSNHAYLHYFFTYRALLVSIVGLLYYTWRCCEEYWRRRIKR